MNIEYYKHPWDERIVDTNLQLNPQTGIADIIVLSTGTCDFCQSEYSINLENVQLAIKQAEHWLNYLKELEDTLSKQP